MFFQFFLDNFKSPDNFLGNFQKAISEISGTNELQDIQLKYFFDVQNMFALDTDISDRRFKDEEWSSNPFFKQLKNLYLLNFKYLENLARIIFKESPKARLLTKIFLEAISPLNFPLTNPTVMKETIKENGQNFIRGIENFLKDQREPKTFGFPSNTNFESFEVGRNIATSVGGVIFKNEFLELIEYQPLTKQSYEKPILMVPPWINKFYILDLSKENSFVRWNLEQGRKVYMISWVNPKESDAFIKYATFEDYIFKGIESCVDIIRDRSGQETINLLGFCISGVAVLCLLAYFAKKSIRKIETATLLATPVDFSYMKDFAPFVDDETMSCLNDLVLEKGIIPGSYLVKMFYFLRSNDLIWSNYVKNYLLGKKPMDMDFLYWNNDTTNLPGKMHLEYLKKFVIDNCFVKDPPYKCLDTEISLSDIDIPIFAVGCKADHIVPWRGAFSITKYCKNVKFVLAGSGHIAGILNHPSFNKYGYFKDVDFDKLPEDFTNIGSWWLFFDEWIKEFSGTKKASELYSWTSAAPGEYVKVSV